MQCVTKKKIVEIFGVPSDLGANTRGTCAGPLSIRSAFVQQKIEALGHTVLDSGDLPVPLREVLSNEIEQHKFLAPIAELAATLKNRVKRCLDEKKMPLVLGGDHSVAIGTINGTAWHFGEMKKKLGVLWIDAHADFNIPSSSKTGNIHGMPLAAVLGQGHDILVQLTPANTGLLARNVALVGIREVDPLEKELLRTSGIAYFTMRDIDERGMPWVMEQALSRILDGTDGIHISFDMDSLDPVYAPGVSTAVWGGLSIREARYLLEKTYESCDIVSMEFVELNPFLDVHCQTADICVDLIQTALGKTII